jgi:hypothetical protein
LPGVRGGGGGGGPQLGTVVLSRGSKLALDDDDLFTYFLSRLARMSCPNAPIESVIALKS